MKRLAICLVGALVLGLLPWSPLAGQSGTADKPRTVQDDASLFSKEAKDKANARIARIKSNFKKDLYIETVPTLTYPDDVTTTEEKNKFVTAWAIKRSDTLKIDGIYVGIIVNPAKYRVYQKGNTLSAAEEKDLEKVLLDHLKTKEMDQALTGVADFVFERIRRNGLLARGLQVIDVKPGDGPPAKRGDTLTMHYIGRLKDGKTFDKTLEPTTFVLKEGVFIKGFEQGVVGMKAGGVRKLVVPPDLAYGKEGVGDIPPGAELQFEIELLKIR